MSVTYRIAKTEGKVMFFSSFKKKVMFFSSFKMQSR
uniref:Uncharacterized protein n=1 Tax=Arundo donax TaxID=35708 RepID=A0A0A9BGP3_ARUDO